MTRKKKILLAVLILLTVTGCSGFTNPPHYVPTVGSDGGIIWTKVRAPVGTLGSSPYTDYKVDGRIKVDGEWINYDQRLRVRER